MKIKTFNEEDYHNVLNLHKDIKNGLTDKPDEPSGNEFYTYRLKQERNFCFVTRELHPSIKSEEIKKELYSYGYKVLLYY